MMIGTSGYCVDGNYMLGIRWAYVSVNSTHMRLGKLNKEPDTVARILLQRISPQKGSTLTYTLHAHILTEWPRVWDGVPRTRDLYGNETLAMSGSFSDCL